MALLFLIKLTIDFGTLDKIRRCGNLRYVIERLFLEDSVCELKQRRNA